MTDLIKTVDVATAKQWLSSGEAILIDVREENEYAEKSVPGSILYPLSSFYPSEVPFEHGKKVIFICRSGARSARACFFFSQEHSDVEAYNLEGGILAWG